MSDHEPKPDAASEAATQPVAETPAWVVPSPGSYPAAAPAHSLSEGSPLPQASDTPADVPVVPDPPHTTATPADPAAAPIRTAVPLIRRPLVIVLGGAGAALLLVGAGFLAGLSARSGDDTSLVAASGAPSARQAPGGGYGDADGGGGWQDGPRGFANANLTVGRITAVQGASLTLATFGGTTVTVTTTSTTTVGGVAGGKLSTLKTGQIVLVAGTRKDDGSIAATAIMTRTGGADGRPGGRSQGDGSGGPPGVGSGPQDQSGTSGASGTSGTSGSVPLAGNDAVPVV